MRAAEPDPPDDPIVFLALPATSIVLPDAAKAQPACGQPIRQPCRPDPRA